LVAGAGECGKLTILKQMKILHLNGFTAEEKKTYRALIYKNTLECIQTLCAACETQLMIPWEHLDNKVVALFNGHALTCPSVLSAALKTS
jgi:hypothetical protein